MEWNKSVFLAIKFNIIINLINNKINKQWKNKAIKYKIYRKYIIKYAPNKQ
jgi:hypothetical protein